MPIDGGIVTGFLAAYAFKKYRDHRKKKKAVDSQPRPAIYYPPPLPPVQEASKELKEELQQVKEALVDAQHKLKSHEDKAGAHGPGQNKVDDNANPDVVKLQAKLEKQGKMKKTKWGNMGGGKRGVPVPAPTATESPKFRKSPASPARGRDIIL